MGNANVSPAGWYYCSYLIRFCEVGNPINDDLEARFSSWENTVLIQANSIEQAYDKTVKIGLSQQDIYTNVEQKQVQWVFEGVTEVLPIYDKLEDGVEIAFTARNHRKLKNLRKMVLEKSTFLAKE